MRIIAGIAKGMRLAAARSGLRPTAERIREAIFSSLGERVAGARVLDLFAGTGALGLEAASRGAQSVVFVDNARAALKCLEQNLENFRNHPQASCECVMVRAEVVAELRRLARQGRKFSLIFADPPYAESAQELLAGKELPQVLAADGVFVLESAKRQPLSIVSPWQLVRDAVYGDTRVSFLARG